MPLRYEENRIKYRTAYGTCVMERQCSVCSRHFTGDRCICPQCAYAKVKEKGKYNKKYHRNYYRKYLSKSARVNEDPRPQRGGLKNAALERQRQRITAEISAIKSAGLSIDDTIYTIQSRVSFEMIEKTIV